MAVNNPQITITIQPPQEPYISDEGEKCWTYVSENHNWQYNWLDLVQEFSQHRVVPYKEQGRLFCGARTSQYEQRKKEHLHEYYLCVLDYDDGTTVDQFRLKYSKFEYLLYTSHNHLKDGKTHKFRVLLPLAVPVPSDGLFGRKAELFKVFPSTDPSTFTRIRHFYSPTVPAERKHLAIAYHNQGQLLDVTPLEYIPVPPPPTKEELLARFEKRSNQTIDPIKQAMAKRNIIDKFSKLISTAHGYNDMRTMAFQLASIGVDISEAIDLISGIPHPSKYSPTERAESGYQYWAEENGRYRTDVLSRTDRTMIKFTNTRQRRGY